MCEFETRLIAWIDGELDAGATLQMDRHVETCESCSAAAIGYRDIGQAFAAYFESAPPARSSRQSRRVAVTVAAMAAAAATALWMLRPPPATLALPPITTAAPPATALIIPPAVKRIERPSKFIASTPAKEMTSEPIIEIAIPADAIFAPGAFPSGFAFAADLSIRGDGSTEGLRVRPATYLK